MSFPFHQPAMVGEVLFYLDPWPGGLYVDCTVGAGSHSSAVLEKTEGKVKILGIDRDEEALKIAGERLRDYEEQVVLVRGNFKDLPRILENKGIEVVDGILYDLGVSSMQMDSRERGFSFRWKGPLDMRMDGRQSLTAAHLVNELPEKELEDIFFNLGEERWARRVAKFIVQGRRGGPLRTTDDLVEIVRKAIPVEVRRKRRIHFATKVFQALRIVVNEELENLEVSLKVSFDHLQNGGRICVISYHSLEDRIVKVEFRKRDGQGLRVLTKKVIRPSPEEIRINPRIRSARLRAVEKA